HGKLWVSSGGGVAQIEIIAEDEGFNYQINPIDLTHLNNAQLAFHITERGDYLWMATDRGLIVHNIDKNSWQIFNRDTGLPFDNF
ncbi:hypothetical protein SB912_31600, partial [Pantoea sp. SIMBA_072]